MQFLPSLPEARSLALFSVLVLLPERNIRLSSGTVSRLVRDLVVVCAFAVGGASLATWRATVRLEQELPHVWEGVDLGVTGIVVSLPAVSESGSRFELAVEQVDPPEAIVPPRIALSWVARSREIIPTPSPIRVARCTGRCVVAYHFRSSPCRRPLAIAGAAQASACHAEFRRIRRGGGGFSSATCAPLDTFARAREIAKSTGSSALRVRGSSTRAKSFARASTTLYRMHVTRVSSRRSQSATSNRCLRCNGGCSIAPEFPI